MNKKIDTLIIGAGLSGLSAGVRISQFQKNVTIVEAHNIPGGLNSYYYRKKKSLLFSSGLHTVTNYNSSTRKWGLGLICRNLGIKKEEFSLSPARYPSVITLGDLSIKFNNDIETLAEEISQHFGDEIDNFIKFNDFICSNNTGAGWFGKDSNRVLASFFKSQQLIDILSVPVHYYSGYSEGSIDFSVFARVYRSLYLEGCCSPKNMKLILELLKNKYLSQGGKIIFNKTVSRLEKTNHQIDSAVLSDGTVVKADKYLSTIGISETGSLIKKTWGNPSNMSLFETVFSFEKSSDDIGIKNTLHFINEDSVFDWQIPELGETTNKYSVSFLDNYMFDEPLSSHQVKICTFQKGSSWISLDKESYKNNKDHYKSILKKKLFQYYPKLKNNKIEYTDSFTPKTIHKFTAHPNGSIYGGDIKSFDGKTEYLNLFIAGNDQGGIGIMGAITSGITIANYNIIL